MPTEAEASTTETGVWLNGRALLSHGRDGGSIPSAPNFPLIVVFFRRYGFFDVVT